MRARPSLVPTQMYASTTYGQVAIQITSRAEGKSASVLCQGANNVVGKVDLETAVKLLPDHLASEDSNEVQLVLLQLEVCAEE